VLGPDFSQVDAFPTRVRLPDEPLMLVDRVLEIHGEPRSMSGGRIVTEHDIRPNAWYLDNGRIPPCIAIEAGQADLLLSGYLGIDFKTEGLAVYRLLDARVRFHRDLPGPGTTIRYDIAIDHFFRRENTWFFHFHFEATVGGQPLLTMSHGCAGFFTPEELSRGKGIVRSALELKAVAGKRAEDWEDFVSIGTESYSAGQLDTLRAGDFVSAFGSEFAKLRFMRPLSLPGGLMKLVHRVLHLDSTGGRFGLGVIRGEAGIHSNDWFLTCHFMDDQVMPGTLMFECCLHTLRIFLLRLGWIVEENQVRLEPVPGIISQLKCRGQVLGSTSKVIYEVSIKELGYGPDPYAIADAEILADGVPIVAVTNMSLRYTGVTRQMLRDVWAVPVPNARKPAVYDSDRIMASALGRPSKAFGRPYEVFDKQRRMACLPAPPFLFMDRITEVKGEPFKLVADGSAEAQYDIPRDAWYFAENRQGDMPFAVLLEVALQPCGWLAAYMGSALTSEQDLYFRNLGGIGRQIASVYPSTGTLGTRVKMTRMSSTAGMLIQWFDFCVRTEAQTVYEGNAYFGFFPESALSRQDGLQDCAPYQPSKEEEMLGARRSYPLEAPFPGSRLRMVDAVDLFIPNGGRNKLGFIRATKRVQAAEWFFKAHFYQDPVMPGSLGLESFLQLLKFIAIERWGHSEHVRWEAVALEQSHEWTYRGQILPSNQLIVLEATVTDVNIEKRLLKADGFLSVDSRIIYGLKNFSVQQCERRIEADAV
jgi:3-hydroxymyristoyl/3-hydroxydecanoyl-(acyl carrier protein) dehydratase